jgi:uncharacterized phage protein (TIGR01671 family)
MREILFRGKREDIGKWIYGDYQHFCIESDIYVYLGPWGSEMRSVKPETVGQFTGLTDKNGKQIFEGDILKFHKFKGEPDWLGFVRYDISMFVIEGEQPVDNGGFEVQLCSIDRKRCEIIGNIHDNPELLGGNDGK